MQGSPLGCGRLEIQGRIKGQHRRSYPYVRCEVHWCCCAAVAAAAAACYVLCGRFLKCRGSVGWYCPALCSGWHARIICAHTHTQKHRSWLSQNKNFQVRLLLCRGCHDVKTLRCDTGTQQQQQQQQQQQTDSKMKKE